MLANVIKKQKTKDFVNIKNIFCLINFEFSLIKPDIDVLQIGVSVNFIAWRIILKY